MCFPETNDALKQAVNVVDPEAAMEEVRRSAEYHRRDHSPHGDFYRRDHSPPTNYNGDYQPEHPDHPGYRASHGGMYHAPHLEVPQSNMVYPGDWRRNSAERPYDYPIQAPHGDALSSYPGYNYDAGHDIQAPEPSLPPSEMSLHQHNGGQPSLAGYDRPRQARKHHSAENAVGPRGWTNV